MPDRDSVIDGLDEIRHYDGEQMFYNDIFIRGIVDDAIGLLKGQQEQIDRLIEENASNAEMAEGMKELLKEHDPIKPRVSSVEQRCGNCNKIIEMDGWKACPWCGKPIDWESWWREHEAYRRR